MGKFDDELGLVLNEDDPYFELFADCETSEDVIQLQREIEEAENAQSTDERRGPASA